MSVRYIYNTSGDYVAFISGSYLFNPETDWLGVIASGDEVYNTDGLYIGHVTSDDRVFRNKLEVVPKRILRPLTPLRPIRPLKPLKRLRLPKAPYPYEDVFGGVVQPVQRLVPSFEIKQYNYLDGAKIVASDKQFLGIISKDAHNAQSISNQHGKYGSPYSEISIFNQYGRYGGQYSSLSPFNPYTSTPPVVVKDGKTLGHLTTNQYMPGYINTNDVIAWLSTT